MLSYPALTSSRGGSSSNATPGDDPNAARKAAAQAAANKNVLCSAIRPLYWEIGDASGVLDSGGVGKRADGSQW